MCVIMEHLSFDRVFDKGVLFFFQRECDMCMITFRPVYSTDIHSRLFQCNADE